MQYKTNQFQLLWEEFSSFKDSYAVNVKCFLMSRLKLQPGSDSDEERGGDQDQDGQKLKQEKTGGNGITTAKKLEKDFLC